MPEEILHNLYRLEIPLPRSPLKALNAYLIKDRQGSLIIDTGMHVKASRQAMLSQLDELNVGPDKTDFFITHMHADHLGLVTELAGPTSRVYFNEVEANMLNTSPEERLERWQKVCGFYLSNGFPEKEIGAALKGHMGYQLQIKKPPGFQILKEGDILQYGEYSFTCIETPGHSPGHLCLYERDKKLLVCGDHILFDITPNITHWPNVENSLGNYLASLNKVYDLDVSLTLPGHRGRSHNHRKRIKELQQHHQNRLEEILASLGDEAKTAYGIAPHVTWDIIAESWDEFPAPQKWFAMGETLAHLYFLEIEGKVLRKIKGKKILFTLA